MGVAPLSHGITLEVACELLYFVCSLKKEGNTWAQRNEYRFYASLVTSRHFQNEEVLWSREEYGNAVKGVFVSGC
jgi:hypothetical protein